MQVLCFFKRTWLNDLTIFGGNFSQSVKRAADIGWFHELLCDGVDQLPDKLGGLLDHSRYKSKGWLTSELIDCPNFAS